MHPRRFVRVALLAVSLTSLATLAASVQTSDNPSPAFHKDPDLANGFHHLYSQDFAEARHIFTDWEHAHPDQPLGQVAIAASYLFEELYRQHVLSSDFFLDQKRFLNGIEGKPDPDRMSHFRGAVEQARSLSKARLKKNPKDPEGLFGLSLAAGMESDAYAILEKKQIDALKRLKEANENAKQLLAVEPSATDAYVSLGAANYIIGSLNAGYRMGLFFLGIHGDKKVGMEQLEKAAGNGVYLQPFAKILLALSARREKQNALAQKLLLELTQEFPANPTYATEYAKAMGRPIPAELKPIP